ncbi:hypothetical protein SESBI_12161 [Sesbania bispinosa]|nr:hypothetical protein SESBI_12161 [Sesbania bispinosa]
MEIGSRVSYIEHAYSMWLLLLGLDIDDKIEKEEKLMEWDKGWKDACHPLRLDRYRKKMNCERKTIGSDREVSVTEILRNVVVYQRA